MVKGVFGTLVRTEDKILQAEESNFVPLFAESARN